MKRLLNINEASEYIGVAKQTLYQWASERRIKFVKMGRLLRFDIEDLNDIINKNKVIEYSG